MKVIAYLIHMNNPHFEFYGQLGAHDYLMKSHDFEWFRLDSHFVLNIQIKESFSLH